MATLIRMPGVAANTDSAIIVSWVVAEGDNIAIGDVLVEIETEKAVIEMAAEQAGILAKILVPAGKEANVGDPIGVLLAQGESDNAVQELLAAELALAPAVALATPPAAVQTAAALNTSVQAATGSPAAAASAVTVGDRIFVSPLARRLAKEAGLDLSALSGSGPHGRIIKRDIVSAIGLQQAAPRSVNLSSVQAVSAATESSAFIEIPHTGMRKTIARRLTESKSSIPHFYLKADCRVDSLLALRAQINASATRKISVNDIVIKAAAAALQEVPAMNVSWTDSALRQYQQIDISVAVTTDTGLITPVVADAANKPITTISRTIGELATRAREGKLAPHEYQGGSFTVSNLGMFGVQEFSAIINPPQAAILAVGAASKRPLFDDGTLVEASIMSVTLSVDHRAIDGAVAAQWLAAFKRIIENPLLALV